jgi:lipoteichoic acid synthase
MNEKQTSNVKRNRDYREIVFVISVITAVFFKFYFLEFAVSDSVLRNPSSVIASLGMLLCLFAPLLLLWHKIRPIAILILDFLLSALIITDVLYMRYYSDLFSFMNIGLSTQVGAISDSVFALFNLTDILYFIDFPFFIMFIFFQRNRQQKILFKSVSCKRCIYVLLLVLLGAVSVAWRFNSYMKDTPGVLSTMWDRPSVCNNIGAISYHLADAWNVVREIYMRGNIPSNELDEIKKCYSEQKVDGSKNPYYGIARGKNLIMLQVESLQQFVIGMKINGVEVTPNLNKFIKESCYFTRIYNQTAAGNSADSEFLANTGLYPAATGVAYTRFANDAYEALPKVLSDKGYNVLALHGDNPGFWNRQNIYQSFGYKRFISKLDFNNDENIGMGLSDRSFFRQASDILKKEKRPFFAFLITLTSHYPYNFPEISQQTRLNVGSFNGMLIGNYLISMHYLDAQFGMFIRELRKNGLLDSSVVVVYGDHNAIPVWDRTNLERLMGKNLKASWLWRDVLKIPLIIRFPDRRVVGQDDVTAGGQIDIPETITALLGHSLPFGLGHDLFNKKCFPVIFRNGSYVYGDVYVEPATATAYDMKNGKKLNYASYLKTTSQTTKRLECSDMILNYDAIPLLK